MRIGIDLGGTKIEIIALSEGGQTLARRRVATPQGDYAATLAAVGGLVAVTPASGFITPASALLIGAVAGVGCYLGATVLKRLLRCDDALDAFGIHGVGGIIGALLTGWLASPAIGGVRGDTLAQLAGICATVVYSGGMTLIVLMAIDRLVGLRVGERTESEGLDLSEHGEAIA